MPLVAVTRKAKLPFLVGRPASNPLTRLRVRPGGRAPAETENVGRGRPVALNAYEVATPARSVAGGVSAVKSGAARMVIEMDGLTRGRGGSVGRCDPEGVDAEFRRLTRKDPGRAVQRQPGWQHPGSHREGGGRVAAGFERVGPVRHPHGSGPRGAVGREDRMHRLIGERSGRHRAVSRQDAFVGRHRHGNGLRKRRTRWQRRRGDVDRSGLTTIQ